jgi:hypothetical protein
MLVIPYIFFFCVIFHLFIFYNLFYINAQAIEKCSPTGNSVTDILSGFGRRH